MPCADTWRSPLPFGISSFPDCGPPASMRSKPAGGLHCLSASHPFPTSHRSRLYRRKMAGVSIAFRHLILSRHAALEYLHWRQALGLHCLSASHPFPTPGIGAHGRLRAVNVSIAFRHLILSRPWDGRV
ncbi:protein of unknown function [Methylacidimicrobium sp. AP8]|nr:protein of unknown function [Methylacidimicrobium sp. AP8]